MIFYLLSACGMFVGFFFFTPFAIVNGNSMGRGAGGETKTKVPYMWKVWIFPGTIHCT